MSSPPDISLSPVRLESDAAVGVIVGIAQAIELIVSGRRVGAPEAAALGIIDEIVEGDLRQAAIAYALQPGKTKRIVSAGPVPPSLQEEIAAVVDAQLKKARGRES